MSATTLISSGAALSPTALTLGNLVLVTPLTTIGYQPTMRMLGTTIPIGKSLLFHYEAENVINIKSDITDHYVEDNSAINDQIALQPERITVSGFIGELNDAPANIVQAAAKAAADKLLLIQGYAPNLSVTAMNAYNDAVTMYNTATSVLNSAVTAWGTISGLGGTTTYGDDVTTYPNQNKQQRMFQDFYAYWKGRTLFKVQTPWAIFNNCAIETLTATQTAETNEITEFSITFKVIRFAETTIYGRRSGRSSSQNAALLDLGTSALA